MNRKRNRGSIRKGTHPKPKNSNPILSNPTQFPAHTQISSAHTYTERPSSCTPAPAQLFSPSPLARGPSFSPLPHGPLSTRSGPAPPTLAWPSFLRAQPRDPLASPLSPLPAPSHWQLDPTGHPLPRAARTQRKRRDPRPGCSPAFRIGRARRDSAPL